MDRSITEVAVKILSGRAHSQQALTQKLLEKKYDIQSVNQVIDCMTERGYLNDTALCDVLLAQYAEAKKYSLREVFLRLRHKGLSASLIRDRLAVNGREDDFDYQAAYKLALKHTNGVEKPDLQKIARRLTTKGFRMTTVNKVLEQLGHMSP